MSLVSLDLARAALRAHGVEVFRVEDDAIQLAKRVRSHLMDSGVCLRFEPEPSVQFTVRAQGSDHPGVPAAQMFELVRGAATPAAHERGFTECATRCREICDPGDDTRVLDQWFELTYAKPLRDVNAALGDVRWALAVAKCIDDGAH